MSNGINDISPTLRDWLLNKNLILSDTIINNGLTSLGVGLGQQANVETPPNVIQPTASIVENGQFYRDLNLLVNPYKSLNGNDEIDINTNTVGNIGNLPVGTQPLDYQQNIGSNNPTSIFNIEADGSREQMLKNKYFDDSLIYKVNLNTVFVSPESDGVYKFKESIINRKLDTLLNATNLGGVSQHLGVIGKDSQLGEIGDKQLIKHFGYNAGAGLLQETIGHINLNPLSLLQGNDIIVPNYSITIPKGKLGGTVDFASRVLGFESPVSLMADSASIFSSENKIDNITRVNAMVLNTGKGQVLSMIDNLNQNKYKPSINDGRKRENITKGDTGTNGELYAFETNEKGRILDLLNTPPPVINSNNNPIIGGVPNPAFNIDLANATDVMSFENEHGKITSVLNGGFNSEFDDLTNKDNSFYDGENEKFGTTKFTWVDSKNKKGKELGVFSGNEMVNKKSLLAKTQSLFKTNRMRNLITAKGDNESNLSEVANRVIVGSSYLTSKGSGVKSKAAIDGKTTIPEEVFCRTWTTFDSYSQVNDLQKNSGVNEQVGLKVNDVVKNTLRSRASKSILDDNSNGFVKVSPYKSDKGKDVKKYMLSLENLAWSDNITELPLCEVGNGDPITKTRGRIMWFPPYEVTFSDTTSVSWDTTNFIGRGEPIYTYNNTERTGTLGFKIIIDYASYMNDLKTANVDNDIFNSIAAGCLDYDLDLIKELSPDEKNKIETETNQQPKIVVGEDSGFIPDKFSMYFPNDSTSIPPTYENGAVTPNDFTYSDGVTFKGCNGGPGTSNSGCNCAQKNSTDYGLNRLPLKLPNDANITSFPNGWQGSNYLNELTKYIVDKCPSCKIHINGYASSDGNSNANNKLSQKRATKIKKQLEGLLITAGDPLKGRRFGGKEKGNGAVNKVSCPKKTTSGCAPQLGVPDVDSKCKKKGRVVTISFTKDLGLEKQITDSQKKLTNLNQTQQLSNTIKSRFISECDYFERMREDSPLVFNRISDKIKYFQPSLHSTTPEGFNSRLTFLQQCTRQGPTTNNSGDPSNLAFGRAPVCILRLGDFYHTKIIIDNVDFTFEPLVWDLNPEGVGVQPMIANVNLSFKFIGGSSLDGPINKLQNALSFNYFANTEVYDVRSDYIVDGVYENGVNFKDININNESETDQTSEAESGNKGIRD